MARVGRATVDEQIKRLTTEMDAIRARIEAVELRINQVIAGVQQHRHRTPPMAGWLTASLTSRPR